MKTLARFSGMVRGFSLLKPAIKATKPAIAIAEEWPLHVLVDRAFIGSKLHEIQAKLAGIDPENPSTLKDTLDTLRKDIDTLVATELGPSSTEKEIAAIKRVLEGQRAAHQQRTQDAIACWIMAVEGELSLTRGSEEQKRRAINEGARVLEQKVEAAFEEESKLIDDAYVKQRDFIYQWRDATKEGLKGYEAREEVNRRVSDAIQRAIDETHTAKLGLIRQKTKERLEVETRRLEWLAIVRRGRRASPARLRRARYLNKDDHQDQQIAKDDLFRAAAAKSPALA
jgi:hypothetical protein